MKKLFMLFAFISLVGAVSVDAQTCSKTKAECCAAAAKAASLDADVEKRICEQSGKVSYVRKSVCSNSGKISYANVEFDDKTKKFVNVSPTHQTASDRAVSVAETKDAKKKGTSCCTKGKSSCTKKTATAVKVSNE